MAEAFKINATLSLRGPANVKPVVNALRSQLDGVVVPITPRLAPDASRTLGGLHRQLQTLDGALDRFQRAARDASGSLKDVRLDRKAADSIADLEKQVRKATGTIGEMAGGLGEANSLARQMGVQLGQTARRFGGFLAVVKAVDAVQSAFREGVRQAAAFQHEMVRVAQVGDASGREIAAIGDEIGKLAARYGTASAPLAEAATTLRQAGLSARDTKVAMDALAKTTVSPTFDSLSNTLEGSIAIMNQFKAGADDLGGALDAVNTVSARFAVESSDIVTAVRKAGGAFRTAAGDLVTSKGAFNQLLGLFTSVRQTTRESADEIATGLRTIFGRLQDDRVSKSLADLGVNLRYTGEEARLLGRNIEGNFVGAYEAIRRLSQATKGLATTDPRFAQIVTQIGGYRQISRVTPLLQEFNTAQKAYAVASASSSSLTRDAAKAQDSFLNKLTKVREEFFTLIRTIGDDRNIKAFLGTTLQLTEGALKLARALEPLVPMIAAIGAIKTIKSFGGIAQGFASEVTTFRTAYKAVAANPVRRASGGIVPGTGRGDKVPATLPAGSFVIRRDSSYSIGHGALARMAAGRRGYQSGGPVDVLLEPGEFVFTDDEARRIGYGKLRRMNQTGKPSEDWKAKHQAAMEADPRHKLAMKIAARGGMRAMYASGGTVTQDRLVRLAERAGITRGIASQVRLIDSDPVDDLDRVLNAAGVIRGSQVVLSRLSRNSLDVNFYSPRAKGIRTLHRGKDGLFDVANDSFHAGEQGRGAATESYARQILYGGISRARLTAARGAGASAMTGYHVWPAKFGIDAPIPLVARAQLVESGNLPPDLVRKPNARISDVLRLPGGEELWKRYGSGFDAEFDPQDPRIRHYLGHRLISHIRKGYADGGAVEGRRGYAIGGVVSHRGVVTNDRDTLDSVLSQMEAAGLGDIDISRVVKKAIFTGRIGGGRKALGSTGIGGAYNPKARSIVLAKNRPGLLSSIFAHELFHGIDFLEARRLGLRVGFASQSSGNPLSDSARLAYAIDEADPEYGLQKYWPYERRLGPAGYDHEKFAFGISGFVNRQRRPAGPTFDIFGDPVVDPPEVGRYDEHLRTRVLPGLRERYGFASGGVVETPHGRVKTSPYGKVYNLDQFENQNVGQRVRLRRVEADPLTGALTPRARWYSRHRNARFLRKLGVPGFEGGGLIPERYRKLLEEAGFGGIDYRKLLDEFRVESLPGGRGKFSVVGGKRLLTVDPTDRRPRETLAHELAHAFDHAEARRLGLDTRFASEYGRSPLANVASLGHEFAVKGLQNPGYLDPYRRKLGPGQTLAHEQFSHAFEHYARYRGGRENPAYATPQAKSLFSAIEQDILPTLLEQYAVRANEPAAPPAPEAASPPPADVPVERRAPNINSYLGALGLKRPEGMKLLGMGPDAKGNYSVGLGNRPPTEAERAILQGLGESRKVDLTNVQGPKATGRRASQHNARRGAFAESFLQDPSRDPILAALLGEISDAGDEHAVGAAYRRAITGTVRRGSEVRTSEDYARRLVRPSLLQELESSGHITPERAAKYRRVVEAYKKQKLAKIRGKSQGVDPAHAIDPTRIVGLPSGFRVLGDDEEGAGSGGVEAIAPSESGRIEARDEIADLVRKNPTLAPMVEAHLGYVPGGAPGPISPPPSPVLSESTATTGGGFPSFTATTDYTPAPPNASTPAPPGKPPRNRRTRAAAPEPGDNPGGRPPLDFRKIEDLLRKLLDEARRGTASSKKTADAASKTSTSGVKSTATLDTKTRAAVASVIGFDPGSDPFVGRTAAPRARPTNLEGEAYVAASLSRATPDPARDVEASLGEQRGRGRYVDPFFKHPDFKDDFDPDRFDIDSPTPHPRRARLEAMRAAEAALHARQAAPLFDIEDLPRLATEDLANGPTQLHRGYEQTARSAFQKRLKRGDASALYQQSLGQVTDADRKAKLQDAFSRVFRADVSGRFPAMSRDQIEAELRSALSLYGHDDSLANNLDSHQQMLAERLFPGEDRGAERAEFMKRQAASLLDPSRFRDELARHYATEDARQYDATTRRGRANLNALPLGQAREDALDEARRRERSYTRADEAIAGGYRVRTDGRGRVTRVYGPNRPSRLAGLRGFLGRPFAGLGGEAAGRLGGIGRAVAGNLTQGAFLATAFAPQLAEQLYGTVANPRGSREAAVRGQVASGTLATAGLGGSIGMAAFGPIGGAVGALAGAIVGYTTSIKDADNQVKEIDFARDFGRSQKALEDVVTGRVDLNRGSVRRAAVGYREASAESGRYANANVGTGIGDLFSSAETIARDRVRARDEKRRELLGGSATAYQGLADQLASRIKLKPEDVAIGTGTSQATLDARRADRLRQFNRAGGGEIARILADLNNLPLKEVVDQIDRVIVTTNRQRIAQESLVKAIDRTTIEAEKFAGLSRAFDAASDSVLSLRHASDTIASLLAGQGNAARISGFAEGARQVGGADRPALERSVAFLRANVGGDASRQLGDTVLAADAASRTLRARIVDKTRLSSEEGVHGDIRGAFGGLIAGNPALSKEVEGRLGTAADTFDSKELRRLTAENPQELVRQLVEKAFGDSSRIFEDVVGKTQEKFNDFGARLDQARPLRERVGETLNRATDASLDTARTRAALLSVRTGRAPEDFLSLDALRTPSRSRQARLGEGVVNPFDPKSIAAALSEVQTRIADVDRTLARPSLVPGGTPGQETEERQRVIADRTGLVEKASNLQRALEHLADTSQELSAIQEKLAAVDRERAGNLNVTERLLTSGPGDLFRFRRDEQLSRVAISQGNFAGFNAQNIQNVLNFLRTVGDARIGKLTGNAHAERLLDRSGRILGINDNALGRLGKQREGLLGEQAKVADRGEQALLELAKVQQSQFDKFIGSLHSENAAFLAKMDELIAAGDVRETGRVAEGADARKAKAAENVAIATRFNGQFALRPGDNGVERAKAILAAPELGEYRDASESLKAIDDRLAVGQNRIRGAFRGRSGQVQLFGQNLTIPETPTDFDGEWYRNLEALEGQLQPLAGAIGEHTGLGVDQVRDKVLPGFVGRTRDLSFSNRLIEAKRRGENPGDIYGQALNAAIQDAAEKSRATLTEQRDQARSKVVEAGYGSTGFADEQERQRANRAVEFAAPRREELGRQVHELPTLTDAQAALDRATREAAAAQEDNRKAAEVLAQAQARYAALLDNKAAPPAPGVAQNRAGGGPIFRRRGTDTVPAMLTPGEFVVNAASTKANRGLLDEINRRKGPVYRAGGGLIPDSLANNDRIPDEVKRRIAAAELRKQATQLAVTKAVGEQDAAQQARFARSRDVIAKQRAADDRRVTAFRARIAPLIGRQRAFPQPSQDASNSISRTTLNYFDYFSKATDFYEGKQRSEVSNRTLAVAARNRRELALRAARYGQSPAGSHARSLLEKFDRSNIGSLLSEANQGRAQYGLLAFGSERNPNAVRAAGFANQKRQKEFADRQRLDAFRRKKDRDRLRRVLHRAEGGPVGRDTVPAMLSEGEYVVNPEATRRNLPLLQDLNRRTIYRAAGGPVGDVKPGAGGGAGLSISQESTSALQQFAKGFSSAVQEFRAPVGQLAGTLEGFAKSAATLTEGFAAVKGLADAMKPFSDAASQLAKSLASVSIPPVIQVQTKSQVEVLINGAQVLAAIKGDMGREITTQVMAQLETKIRDVIGNLPAR